MSGKAHLIGVREALASGLPTLYRAQCTCGWRGEATTNKEIAVQEKTEHGEAVLRAMTGPAT